MIIPGISFAAHDFSATFYAHTVLGNDVYSFWETLEINETINGDALLAGRKISIRGTIEEDVQAAGAEITIDGTINDDARLAGGAVFIDGHIVGDLIIFGNSVIIGRRAVIDGNLIAYGNSIEMNGIVHGTASVGGASIIQNGIIGGFTTLNGKRVSMSGSTDGSALIIAQELEFLPGAHIAGDLRYWREGGEADFGSVVEGMATYDPEFAGLGESARRFAFSGLFAIGALFLLLSGILMIALFQFATKTLFIDSAKSLRAQPLRNFIRGFLYFILTPLVIAFLFITIIGIPLGIALLCLYLLVFLFTNVIAAMVLARLLELKRNKTWLPLMVFGMSIGIYALLHLLLFIPYVGWLFNALIIIVTYGSFLEEKIYRFKKMR